MKNHPMSEKEIRAYMDSRLSYDSATGVFIWKNGPNKNKVAGCTHKGGKNPYIIFSLLGKTYLGHRIAWLLTYGKFPNGVIDHINGNSVDNRIANLRDTSVRENTLNNNKNRLNGFGGVFRSGKRYRASIRIGSIRKHLGCFATQEEAHSAYVLAKSEIQEDTP